MTSSPADEPVRRAGDLDTPALVELLLRAWSAAGRPSDVQVATAHVTGALSTAEVWLVGFDRPRGLLVLEGDHVCDLWIEPALRGEGIGSRLVALAQLRRPGGLHVEPIDDPGVRRFFARHGFVGDDGSISEPVLRWRP